jgi:hypothetical protein
MMKFYEKVKQFLLYARILYFRKYTRLTQKNSYSRKDDKILLIYIMKTVGDFISSCNTGFSYCFPGIGLAAFKCF